MIGHNRIVAIERRLLDAQAEIRKLWERVRRADQNIQTSGGGRAGGGGASCGGAWAEAAVVPAGGSAELTVYEVRTAGDIDKGEQTVHNRYGVDTDPAGGPLILVRNPDGSYLIVGQGCTPPEEE